MLTLFCGGERQKKKKKKYTPEIYNAVLHNQHLEWFTGGAESGSPSYWVTKSRWSYAGYFIGWSEKCAKSGKKLRICQKKYKKCYNRVG